MGKCLNCIHNQKIICGKNFCWLPRCMFSLQTFTNKTITEKPKINTSNKNKKYNMGERK